VHHPDPALTLALQQILPRAGQRIDEGFAAEVRAAARIVVRNDLTEATMQAIAGPLWPYLQPLNYGAIMIVPLIVDGAYLGTMSCGIDRAAAALAESLPLAPDATAYHIYASLLTNGHHEDDVALLVYRQP
jgi:hypothetical protein